MAQCSPLWAPPSILLSTSIAQGVDQKREGRRRLPTARVIEVVPCEGLTPIGEHPHEPPSGDLALHLVLRQIGQAEASHGRVKDQRAGIERELPVDPYAQLARALLELPAVDAAMGRQAED